MTGRTAPGTDRPSPDSPASAVGRCGRAERTASPDVSASGVPDVEALATRNRAVTATPTLGDESATTGADGRERDGG
ncbi:hypothetical protein [Halobellus rarus]|uniref:Uncharacterized protein n=1 Tax=Halobellus rarus TaxID=1126237 RepID=A0ABD6CI90_9EURY|nr:hypothetical protein [Halobellus rarus]